MPTVAIRRGNSDEIVDAEDIDSINEHATRTIIGDTELGIMLNEKRFRNYSLLCNGHIWTLAPPTQSYVIYLFYSNQNSYPLTKQLLPPQLCHLVPFLRFLT